MKTKLELTRIRNLRSDISDINISQTYARVISIATLEHLTDLPGFVARCGLLLLNDQVFYTERAGFCGVSWRMSTAIAFKLKRVSISVSSWSMNMSTMLLRADAEILFDVF